MTTLHELGLGVPRSWLLTLALAVSWLGLMIGYTPIADWLATRWVDKPPTLTAFRAIQQSKGKLIAGIGVAWLLGGIGEEILLRGVVLRAVEIWSSVWAGELIGTGFAICAAAVCAGLIHFYQGLRAMVIVTQLSVLFGVLFVVSGWNLWGVMLCHGLYDTIAFMRFAKKKSKYSRLERARP